MAKANDTKKETTTEVEVDKEMKKQLEAMQKQMEALQKQLSQKDEEIKVIKDKSKSRDIDRNKRVAVRSVQDGGLTYISRSTGLTTTWSDFGDEQWIEVEELIRMKSSKPAFLTNPWVIIDDEEIVEYLGLKNIYEKIVSVDELDSFFAKSPSEIEAVLRKAPKGTKKLIASKARKMVEQDQLDSIKVKRAIENALEIDLSIVE